MSFTWNICSYLNTIRQADTRNLPQRRIGLLWCHRANDGANSALLWGAFWLSYAALLHGIERILQRGRFALYLLGFATLSN
jgi:hypothetical protein